MSTSVVKDQTVDVHPILVRGLMDWAYACHSLFHNSASLPPSYSGQVKHTEISLIGLRLKFNLHHCLQSLFSDCLE